jgi:hypothetical protein
MAVSLCLFHPYITVQKREPAPVEELSSFVSSLCTLQDPSLRTVRRGVEVELGEGGREFVGALGYGERNQGQ